MFQYVGFRNTTSRNAPNLITENENEAVTCYVECKTKFIGLQVRKGDEAKNSRYGVFFYLFISGCVFCVDFFYLLFIVLLFFCMSIQAVVVVVVVVVSGGSRHSI